MTKEIPVKSFKGIFYGNELDGHVMPTGKKMGLFEGKTICVFGGTGTIGTLIVEYLITQKPYAIRIFSNDENSLWECQQKWGNKNPFRYLLGDVRDFRRVKRALKDVDYVFNCAAIKHVPFAEYNPIETIHVNIDGLDNIIDGCVHYNIKKLLHISTDKAVEPTTLMGMSKGISEKLVQIRWTQNPKIQMIVVRLGNVYGSRGSIVPIIRKQKADGQPITITNPDMERFFMMPDEVIKFIIKAFREGGRGDIWVPKLKESKLMDVIEKEVGKDYPITIIGSRKGEKLREILLTDYEKSISRISKEEWVIRNSEG